MKTDKFSTFLSQLSNKPIKVVDKDIDFSAYVPIDISSKNKELNHFDISSAAAWKVYINNVLKNKNAQVAFGGYLEKRDIYERSSYFKNQKANNSRNIHLGIDLWCKKNTDVLAVLNGEIHSFKNNTNFGDYGPTLILKHQIENEIFYSLYGHLSLESIENISIGTKIDKEQVIGSLGDSSVNGNYAPHLHFQLIRNLENHFGDYPGVCSIENLDFYKENCPNPNLLLKLE